MCGRFAVVEPVPDLARLLGVAEGRLSGAALQVPIRYNIAPLSKVFVVARAADGARGGDALLWGLVPSFARDPSGAAHLINARGETVWETPSFRDAIARRRCLVPVSGFYEWRRRVSEGGKRPPALPYFFRRTDLHPLVLGGIWAEWRGREPGAQRLRTFSIVTTEANALVGQLHDRMPVVLPESAWDTWLSPDTPRERVEALLRPAGPETLCAFPVTSEVNRSTFEDPRAIVPAGEALGASNGNG